MSKSRCRTCGKPAVIRGPDGARGCLEHVTDVGEPRWLKLPSPESTAPPVAETAEAMNAAGALTPELARYLERVSQVTLDDAGELTDLLDEIERDAADAADS